MNKSRRILFSILAAALMTAALSPLSAQNIEYVTTFGAKCDGSTNDTAAFNSAIAAIGALPTQSGIVEMPSGICVVNSTLDLTGSSVVSLWLRGQGPRATIIRTSVTSTAGINAASSSTKHMKLSDFGLQQSGGVLPSTQRSGNYGIRNTSGIGYGLSLERVEVMFFGDSAIHIEGPTGPTTIKDCSLQYNAGYGVETIAVSGSAPSDVTISGGNIQSQWGGVLSNGSNSLSVADADIELGTSAQYPCAYLSGGTNGAVLTGVTCSTSAVTTPAANIAIDSGVGNVIIGGINACNSAMDNILFSGSGTYRNSVIGGHYYNQTTGGGYFGRVSGAVNNTFVNPELVPGYFASGKDEVLDGTTNYTVAIGVKTAARASADQNGLQASSVSVDQVGLGATNSIRTGTGSPNNALVGYVGDIFLRTDGSTGSTLYVKETGNNTNTGWVAK